MRVERWLAHRARSHGERTALVAGGQKLSYAELEQRCQVVASQLSDAGVTEGCRLMLVGSERGVVDRLKQEDLANACKDSG